jgi:hypothetical protein
MGGELNEGICGDGGAVEEGRYEAERRMGGFPSVVIARVDAPGWALGQAVTAPRSSLRPDFSRK